MFLTVVAVLSMAMAFAENESASGVNEASAYNVKVSMRSLTNYLGLSEDQAGAVAEINAEFCAGMMNAYAAEPSERDFLVRNAVYRNLSGMRLVLTKEQYSAYLRALNATFNNRGLNVRF